MGLHTCQLDELCLLFFRGVSSHDFEGLEKIMKKITTEKQPFERLEISKEDLMRLFGVRMLM